MVVCEMTAILSRPQWFNVGLNASEAHLKHLDGIVHSPVKHNTHQFNNTYTEYHIEHEIDLVFV